MASTGVLEHYTMETSLVEVSGCSLSEKQEFHVLAVDDSFVDRKVIEKLLRVSSCKVTTVNSGKSALQCLGLDGESNSGGINGLKVNMIITDYSMPGMTGYELLKKIKKSLAFREVPVVIMSSENIKARIDRCLEEGAEEYIVKPVKLSDVKRLKDFVFRDDSNKSKEKMTTRKRYLPDGCKFSSSASFHQLTTSSASSSPVPSFSPFSCSSPEHPPCGCRRLHVRS